ncbi:MAG: fumarylacetoacetate hydrolase family protein [Desulfobacteraceae bacterium]|jgi:2-keto-4-pentenoate hydratase/2-oxohepta-3-ene-1,7-dioic acid hydratase in catechol pathway
MKLIRFGPPGHEQPGIWKENKIVDLRSIYPEIPDIGEQFFRDGWIEKLAGLEADGQSMDVRLGAPVFRPEKIVCLGKNYAEHAKEGGFDMPEAPLLFCKTPNALNGPFDPILVPISSDQIDWEVELAVVIGKKGVRIPQDRALDYIAGYTVMNDVSGRRAQFAHSQWFRGKSFDTFAPLGPALVTPDEVGDVQNLRLTATVNGEVMQDGTTRDMIFSIEDIISDLSQDITLVPGDIISTGTPAGVGIFRDPPVVLNEGDEVECWIEKIGSICNKVVASRR